MFIQHMTTKTTKPGPPHPGPTASMSEWLAHIGNWMVQTNTSMDIDANASHAGSWRGHRDLNSELRYRIRIYGRKSASSFGFKPYLWSAELDLSGMIYHIKSSHPSCKSIKDACIQADRALTLDAYQAACKHFYSHSQVVCVAKATDPVATRMWAAELAAGASDLVGKYLPWASMFGRFRIIDFYGWGSRMRVKPGTYATAEKDRRSGKVRQSIYQIDGYGYSGGGSRQAAYFDHWLPSIALDQAIAAHETDPGHDAENFRGCSHPSCRAARAAHKPGSSSLWPETDEPEKLSKLEFDRLYLGGWE